jgi:signal transduction histidine kinase
VKLLTKYNRANIITAVFILLVSSVTYYFIIRLILLQQLDKDLKVEEQEIHEYVKENNALPNATRYKGQQIKFEIAKDAAISRKVISSTIKDVNYDEEEPVRVLSFPIKINGVLYKAIVIKSQLETEDLLKLIMIVTGAMFLLLLVIISLINRLLLSKLWQPFYNTLQEVQAFNLKTSNSLNLPSTNIEEFVELNKSVTVMTKRARQEFEMLKAFTENASHEMQTPLAIINSKLDLLLQTLNEKQAEQIQAVYDATGRLTKLNQTLLLLTKIENEQFGKQDLVDFKLLVKAKLEQFDELIKGISLSVGTEGEDTLVNINKELADILLNNLFSNAIRHNYVKGFILCKFSKTSFSISNSGHALPFDENKIFHRFQKGYESSGTGLGLAVVQQICETSGFAISYKYSNNEHTFTINFESIYKS